MSYPERTITLTKGFTCRVSLPDYERFSHYAWKCDGGDNLYARRVGIKAEGPRRGKTIYLHREIMLAPSGLVVNHIDGNPLNCTRPNLELALSRHNTTILRVNKGKLGFAGVDQKRKWLTGHNDYRARASIPGDRKFLGHFSTAEDAAREYDRFMVGYYGHLAATNFPLSDYFCLWEPPETVAYEVFGDIPF